MPTSISSSALIPLLEDLDVSIIPLQCLEQTLTLSLVAPKFPTPVNLAFLLRLGTFPATVEDVVGDMECEHAKFMAMATLKVNHRTCNPNLILTVFTEYGQRGNP